MAPCFSQVITCSWHTLCWHYFSQNSSLRNPRSMSVRIHKGDRCMRPSMKKDDKSRQGLWAGLVHRPGGVELPRDKTSAARSKCYTYVVRSRWTSKWRHDRNADSHDLCLIISVRRSAGDTIQFSSSNGLLKNNFWRNFVRYFFTLPLKYPIYLRHPLLIIAIF